jgi:predicted O-methyltransferase YrrM
MIRAVWCLLRHLKPEKVIETGVARGFTSRFILEALERNSAGYLWSIDLPPVLAPELHAQVGAAITPQLRHRWSYVRGTSRQRLQKLLERVGEIGLFVHDSRHTEENLRFELDKAWIALQPGGAMVADDIDTNWGFHSFNREISGYQVLTCYAEPLRPDVTRFEAKGLFGIARKTKMIED